MYYVCIKSRAIILTRVQSKAYTEPSSFSLYVCLVQKNYSGVKKLCMGDFSTTWAIK